MWRFFLKIVDNFYNVLLNTIKYLLQKDKVQSKKSQNFKRRKFNKKYHFKRFKLLNDYKDIFLVVSYCECNLHLQHLVKLRKKIKKLKRVGFLTLKPKIWVIFTFNKILSKKGKNARMGKGKGEFISWLIHIRKYATIIKIYDINKNTVLNIINSFKIFTNKKFIFNKT